MEGARRRPPAIVVASLFHCGRGQARTVSSDVTIATDDHAVVYSAALDGIVRFNERHFESRTHASIAESARNEKGAIVGGAAGHLYVDCFFLDLLWVEEAYRGRGIGTALLGAIERQARGIGSTKALLDTFDFQAAPFYERRGYVEEGRLVGMVGGHDRIVMTKRSL